MGQKVPKSHDEQYEMIFLEMRSRYLGLLSFFAASSCMYKIVQSSFQIMVLKLVIFQKSMPDLLKMFFCQFTINFPHENNLMMGNSISWTSNSFQLHLHEYCVPFVILSVILAQTVLLKSAIYFKVKSRTMHEKFVRSCYQVIMTKISD